MGKRYKEKTKSKRRYKIKKSNKNKLIMFSLVVISTFFIMFLSGANSMFSDKISPNIINISTSKLSVKMKNLKVYEDTSDLTNFVIPNENRRN